MDFWKKINEQLGTVEVEVVATVLRKILVRRNAVVFDRKFVAPMFVLRDANDDLHEFSITQDLQQILM